MAPTLRCAFLTALIALAGCGRNLPDSEPATGGSPKRGKELIQHYGCGSCHSIPGVPGANATLAPPLDKLKSRVYLAGRLQNTPENVIHWIRSPRAVDPKTAMPNVGLDESGARDVAAYLYSL
jgi:cytochrome c